MARPLRVLILAPTTTDADGIVDQLRRGGFDPEWVRIHTREAYISHLGPDKDLVVLGGGVSDVDLLEALGILQAREPTLPSIVVTDGGRDIAEACLEAGAADCLSRGQLWRLPRAVEHVLELQHLRERARSAGDLEGGLEALRVHQEELRQTNEHLHEARTALERERERYYELFEFAPAGYVLTDEQGIIEETNRAAEAVLNTSRDQLAGKPLVVFVDQQDRPTFWAKLAEATEGAQVASWPCNLSLPGGERLPVELTASRAAPPPALADSGKKGPVRLRWVIRDVTETRRAQDAYCAIVKHSLQGLCIIQEGRVVFANQRLADMFGYQPEELLAMSPKEALATLAPDDQDFVLQLREDREAGRPVPSRYEIRVRTKEGDVRWTEQFVSSVEYRGKSALQIAVIDITDRKEAQEELERRARQLRAINELAVDLATVSSTEAGFRLIADTLKGSTGALAASVSAYDAEQKELVVRCVAAEGWLVDRANQLLDRRIVGWANPVDEENYERMVTEIVSTSSDLAETTFDAVRGSAARAIQRALRMDRFVGVALVDRGDLIGTAVLAFSREQRAPSDEVLKTFARVAAASLRQRQAEEEVHRVSEERRVIFDLAPMGITITDEAGEIIAANRMSAELLGLPVEDQIGRDYDAEEWEIVRPDGSPMPPPEYASTRALEDRQIVRNVEMGIVKPDDEITWISVSAAPIPLPDYGVAISYADISDRRRAEEALRESESRFRATFEDASVGIALVDRDGRPFRSNRALQEMLGYSGEELEGMRFTEFTHPDDLADDLGRFRELMNGRGTPYQVEKRYLCKEGRVIWARLNVSLARGPDGQPAFAVGMVEDITERKHAEEELRESEFRLAQIIEGTSLAGFVIDENHIVTHWNRACEKLTGTSSDEIVGTRDHWHAFYSQPRLLLADLIVDGASKAELERYFEGQLRESNLIPGAYEGDRFFPQLGRDGKWLFFSAAPISGLDGATVGAVEIIRDVTRRREAEERLERRVSELMLLSEIGRRVAGTLDLEAILREAAQALHERFGYHNALVLTIDPNEDVLTVRAVAGQYAAVPHHELSVGLDQGVTGWCARHGETVLVNDVATDSRYVNSYPDRIVSRSELAVPIRVTGEVVGVLDVQSDYFDAFDENDVILMETLADQIAVAMENARLYEAERTARQELGELAGHLQEAREKERTRIAREIHDEFGQMMTALKMDISWLSKRLPNDAPQLATKVDAMSSMVDRSFGIVRRVSSELRPSILDDLGLAAAIEWQAEQFSQRSGIDTRLHLDDPSSDLNRRASTALFRILQEALTNVARHAHAGEVKIRLTAEPDAVALAVTDDGRGITEDEIAGARSLGLVGMRERARSLGGELTVEGISGESTTVTARVPLKP